MRAFLFVLSAVLLVACGDSSTSENTENAGGSGGDGGAGGAGGEGDGGTGGGGPLCTEPTAISCADQMIQEMALQPSVSTGTIQSTLEGGTFSSVVDATAGGAFANPPGAYVYAKFDEAGLAQVAVSDEQALESMDWDIAFRRYVIRVNSGDSGPSCVKAARLAPGSTFETAAAPADAMGYHADDFYTDTCELVPDGSGLPSSPATVLASYYSYPGCVDMTGNIYVLQLADGRKVKLEILGYYFPLEHQTYCHENAAAPQPPNGSGTISLRWAFLE